MYKSLLVFILLYVIISGKAIGQSSAVLQYHIEKNRLLWHDKVDRAQASLMKLDGKNDNAITLSRDETVNLQIEYALIKGVDELQEKIERDSTLLHNSKIKYLLGLESLVKGYNSSYQKKDFPITIAQALMDGFTKAMELEKNAASIEPVISENSYPVGKILVDCFCFRENKGIQASNILLVRKYIALHPTEILTVLKNSVEVPFADSLIRVAAYQNPRQVYDYAAARDRLGARIRANPDSFVKTVAKMASSKSGQLYFPFIDMLVKGKISFEDIDKVKDNALNYYRLLVNTRIEYAGRMVGPQKDTPMEMKSLTEMMAKKAKDDFISQINGLHDSPDAVRFKILDPLTPQELYYLCVLGEDEIYTSSYLGVFKRIFQRMKVPRGDTLVMSVNADYFRKFIKLAAAYNTLETLLNSMPAESATSLMRAFMIGLEKTTTPSNAEDAVDVADSYSSIFEKNKSLSSFMLTEAIWNYERCIKNADKNGQVIYNLEKTLFESAEDTLGRVNLTEKLGIAPVYSVDYSSLVDDSGRVVQQVFFYGDQDKDGQNSYANFLGTFRGKPEWSITENNPDWIWIRSTKGKPVWIFANKPLYGPDDPDAKAQEKLNDYLYERNIKPSIYIHRGHSYHVKYSLSQIQPSARIVVLGSCGGYNNLNEVLTISNDAHIISSKQVGTKTVNEPILEAIDNTLRNGKSIEWIPMWRDLSKLFKGEKKELFDDYIPPYKNLGAIFIKAYRKALGDD